MFDPDTIKPMNYIAWDFSLLAAPLPPFLPTLLLKSFSELMKTSPEPSMNYLYNQNLLFMGG